MLAGAGHQPIELSFATLVPQPAELARLARADLRRYDRVIFVSPASVGFAATVLGGAPVQPGSLCAIGTGSGAALLEAGLVAGEEQIVHPPQPPYDADALCALRDGARCRGPGDDPQGRGRAARLDRPVPGAGRRGR
ncbi:MAG: hypothetical protein R3E68_13315 [Burkholderiaceae bacterium]